MPSPSLINAVLVSLIVLINSAILMGAYQWPSQGYHVLGYALMINPLLNSGLVCVCLVAKWGLHRYARIRIAGEIALLPLLFMFCIGGWLLTLDFHGS